MRRKNRYKNKGLTFIEIMLSVLVSFIIVIGMMSYMYASALDARKADIRITATRIGQLLLETWKVTGHIDETTEKWSWDVLDFDPTEATFNSALPASFGTASIDLGGEGIELGDYVITIDSVQYFVTLLYNDVPPNMLSARVAWSRYSTAGTIGSDPKWIDVTSYAIY